MDKWLYRISVVLVVIGLAVSIYMTIYKVTSNNAMCLGSGDCSTVNASRYAEVYGIPVATIGIAGYFAILMVHWYERRLYLLKRKTLQTTDAQEQGDSPEILETPTESNDATEQSGEQVVEKSNPDEFFEKNGPMLIFGMALTGFLFTLYLIYVEFALLNAICPFCLTSQISMTIIFIISVIRLIRQPQ
jgi:uncharacterized membrane protein